MNAGTSARAGLEHAMTPLGPVTDQCALAVGIDRIFKKNFAFGHLRPRYLFPNPRADLRLVFL